MSVSAASAAPGGGSSSSLASAARFGERVGQPGSRRPQRQAADDRVGVRLDEVEPALEPTDRDRLEGGAGRGRLDQRRATEAGHAIDHDQGDVAFRCRQQVVVWIAIGAGDDEEVGVMAIGQRPDGVPPAQHRRRVTGGHRDEVAILVRAGRQAGVDDPGDLELGQEIAAAARRPVRAQGDRHVVGVCRRDVRRPAVEQQVAQRRPHDPDAVVVEDREVTGLEPVGVDRHERRRERPAVIGQVEGGEVDARGRPEPFGEVEDQLVRLVEAGQEVLGLGRLDVGDLRQRIVEVHLARVLDVADVAAVELLDPVVAVQRDALRGRHARHEALALDIADDRLRQAEGLAEDRHRAADRLAVRLDARPLAAVLVDLERRPERQRVVAQVVVELDQPGVDRALGGDARRASRSRAAGRQRRPGSGRSGRRRCTGRPRRGPSRRGRR